MEIQTTHEEDTQAEDLLDEVVENAILVGRGELDENDLPTSQILWEKLMKIVGVEA